VPCCGDTALTLGAPRGQFIANPPGDALGGPTDCRLQFYIANVDDQHASTGYAHLNVAALIQTTTRPVHVFHANHHTSNATAEPAQSEKQPALNVFPLRLVDSLVQLTDFDLHCSVLLMIQR
jgi:hypothetical protein